MIQPGYVRRSGLQSCLDQFEDLFQGYTRSPHTEFSFEHPGSLLEISLQRCRNIMEVLHLSNYSSRPTEPSSIWADRIGSAFPMENTLIAAARLECGDWSPLCMAEVLPYKAACRRGCRDPHAAVFETSRSISSLRRSAVRGKRAACCPWFSKRAGARPDAGL